ncbi:hypothetical protein [Desulfosediminicola flagellatus]|uniref:hypothetical protein n=1 Tax=Desulfosediminicola flagellatus TaxID=2569541 RepID=UPI0010AD0577|nr:hypothetical protein [Desulfosediminicola flagellatus]
MKLAPGIAICVVLVTTSCAMALPRVGQRPEGICTRDLNLWGNASQCSCTTGDVYNERSGLCLQGDNIEQITVQGAIIAGMMAIGGESTGFSIKTPEGDSYELILTTADQDKFTRLNGMWFEVEGELITIDSVKIKGRKAIIADRIAVLE